MFRRLINLRVNEAFPTDTFVMQEWRKFRNTHYTINWLLPGTAYSRSTNNKSSELVGEEYIYLLNLAVSFSNT